MAPAEPLVARAGPSLALATVLQRRGPDGARSGAAGGRVLGTFRGMCLTRCFLTYRGGEEEADGVAASNDILWLGFSTADIRGEQAPDVPVCSAAGREWDTDKTGLNAIPAICSSCLFPGCPVRPVERLCLGLVSPESPPWCSPLCFAPAPAVRLRGNTSLSQAPTVTTILPCTPLPPASS